MNSRSHALIDGTYRKNNYETSGTSNLAYWDDPSYSKTPSELKGNSAAYKDGVVNKGLMEPRTYGTPYLSHDEMSRIVSKQFADDIKERAHARAKTSSTSVIIVFVASFLTTAGLFDTFAYAGPKIYPQSNTPIVDFAKDCTNTPAEPLEMLVWVWITAGIWSSILPTLVGMFLGCSKQASNADHNHTFDPLLRVDGNSGKTKKSNKKYFVLVIISIILLVLGFICGIVDVFLFISCSSWSGFLLKLISSVMVCILSIVVIILLIVYLVGSKKQKSLNSNYDRRDYDIKINYGRFDITHSNDVSRSIEDPLIPVVDPNAVQQPPPVQLQQNELLATPNYSAASPIQPPPQPATGPSIFAGTNMPLRGSPGSPGSPYRRPVSFQMPTFSR